MLDSEAVVVASTVVLGAPALTTVVVLSVGLENVVFRDTLGPPVPALPVPDSVTLPERVTVAFATEDEKVVVRVEVLVLCAMVMVDRTEEALERVVVLTPPLMGNSPL